MIEDLLELLRIRSVADEPEEIRRAVDWVCEYVDVESAGPLDEWESDPFEPVERDGWLVCRPRGRGGRRSMCMAYERA